MNNFDFYQLTFRPHEKGKAFQTWLPRIFWRPLTITGTFIAAFIAYSATTSVISGIGITHPMIPLLCSLFALIAVYRYLGEDGAKLHRTLIDIGKQIDKGKDLGNFYHEHKRTIWVTLLGFSVFFLVIFPPFGLGPFLGAGGTVAAAMGLSSVSSLIYASLMAILVVSAEAIVTPLLATAWYSLKCLFNPNNCEVNPYTELKSEDKNNAFATLMPGNSLNILFKRSSSGYHLLSSIKSEGPDSKEQNFSIKLSPAANG